MFPGKDNRIITYQLDDRDGTLNEVDSDVDGGPGALAAHPINRSFMLPSVKSAIWPVSRWMSGPEN